MADFQVVSVLLLLGDEQVANFGEFNESTWFENQVEVCVEFGFDYERWFGEI